MLLLLALLSLGLIPLAAALGWFLLQRYKLSQRVRPFREGVVAFKAGEAAYKAYQRNGFFRAPMWPPQHPLRRRWEDGWQRASQDDGG